MRQQERVAELRRALPQGAPVKDYVFREGPADSRRRRCAGSRGSIERDLQRARPAMVVYQFMYGKLQTTACPMCTLWIDGWDGAAHHIAQNADFVILAAADLPTLRAHARARGWEHLRLLSAGIAPSSTTFGSEDEEGNQESTISVFTRDPTAGFVTSIPPHHGWHRTSASAGSTCCARSGTSSI